MGKSPQASESRPLQVPRGGGQTPAPPSHPLPAGETRLPAAELTAGACVCFGWFKQFYFLKEEIEKEECV